MADLSNYNLGLNEISVLHLNNYNRKNRTHKSNIKSNIEIEMDNKSGLSRIPKLTFSSKRTDQASENSRIPSRESTPDRFVVKSAPSSSQSSPSVGRSKSLRLPRKQYGVLGSHSASKMRESLAGKSSQGSKGRGRDKDSSSPGSSRASSPGITMAMDHVEFTNSAEINSDLKKTRNTGNTGSDSPFRRRRAQSFGPHVRRPVTNRQLRPPTTWSRENTPTPNAPRSVTPSSLLPPSSRRQRGGGLSAPSSPRHVRSRSSLDGNEYASHGGRNGSIMEEDTDKKSLKVHRVASNDMVDGVGLSTGINGRLRGRGRRPNSYVMNETADLNQLAHEITSSMGDSSLHTPEVKSVARLQSTARHRDLTSSVPSGKVGVVSSGSHTPLANTQRGMSSKTRSTSLEKLHTPLGRGSRYTINQKTTPEIGGNGKNGRFRSASLIGSGGPHEEGKSHSRGAVNSRSSTPSSGRSTPGTPGDKKSRMSPTNEVTPAGGQSRLMGSRLKMTQRRVVRVREVRPVGINELEGAVLMDADEYLKISHEVKALKTAMLKLKRELQTDLQAGGHAADSGLTPSAGKTPRRSGSGSQTNELSTRIDQLTAEKAKVQEEAEKHKKELQRLSEQLHRSNSDLKRVEEEKSSLSERLQQMESHRDLLLDKVERLHADKHKLEDRLSSLEKSQFYEESWVEEGGVEWEESLMLGGVKGEKTESDTGENSEPESSAVCSGPNS